MHGQGSQARREFIQAVLGRIPRTTEEWKLAQPKLRLTQMVNGKQRELARVQLRRLGA